MCCAQHEEDRPVDLSTFIEVVDFLESTSGDMLMIRAARIPGLEDVASVEIGAYLRDGKVVYEGALFIDGEKEQVSVRNRITGFWSWLAEAFDVVVYVKSDLNIDVLQSWIDRREPVFP